MPSKDVAFAPKPDVVIGQSKDVSMAYAQTDSLKRLREDIENIPEPNRPPFDVFSIAVGVIPTSLIGLFCNWDSTTVVFKVHFVAIILALVIIVVCAVRGKKKPSSDMTLIAERIRIAKTDIQYICKQAAIDAELQTTQQPRQD